MPSYLATIEQALSPYGLVWIVLGVILVLLWWALWGQDMFAPPWGTKVVPEDRRACEHRGCGRRGRGRLDCDFLVCHERELAQAWYGTPPPKRGARVISIEGCAAEDDDPPRRR